MVMDMREALQYAHGSSHNDVDPVEIATLAGVDRLREARLPLPSFRTVNAPTPNGSDRYTPPLIDELLEQLRMSLFGCRERVSEQLVTRRNGWGTEITCEVRPFESLESKVRLPWKFRAKVSGETDVQRLSGKRT